MERRKQTFMTKAQKKTADRVWLRLSDYQVVGLKPEIDEYAIRLERAIQNGVPACPDSTRTDFYDVEFEDGHAYIHVYRETRTIYLVARSFPTEFALVLLLEPEIRRRLQTRPSSGWDVGADHFEFHTA
jgi:hypothetical protein